MYSLTAQLEWDKAMTFKKHCGFKNKPTNKKTHLQNICTRYVVVGRAWAPQTSCCTPTFYY